MVATSTAVVNSALYYILAMSALLLFGIVFCMIYFLVRFRASRNPVPTEIKGSPLLEAIWIIVPTLIAGSMFVIGLTGFQFLRKAPADAIVVKVYARQWSWLFEYDDGKKSADLIVPVGKNIRCDLVSADVIHGFYIPAFRIQEDMIPGIKTFVWFKATSPGTSTILCSQYCGRKHSGMIANLLAVPPDQFDAWRQGKAVQFTTSYGSLPRGQALLFERGCISCHSVDGAAMMGPTFKKLFGSDVTVSTAGQRHDVVADSGYIYESIIHPNADIVVGYPATMPAGRDVLSDEEINTIITYLKTLQ
jgi:cytochrome c oxidase subunit 2